MDLPNRARLRRELRRRRAQIPPPQRSAWDCAIQQHAWELLVSREVRVLFGYWAVRDEVATLPLLERWIQSGRELVLSRPDPEARTMILYRVERLSEEMEPGPWGIPQPRAVGSPLDPKRVQAALVPGLGFSDAGFRLGSGAGFYDRFLASWPHIWRIGLFYELQRISEGIPACAWDVPLDVLVTERGCHILRDWPEVRRKRPEETFRSVEREPADP